MPTNNTAKSLQKPLPILTYSTGAGWSALATASCLQSAERVIKQKLLTDNERQLIKSAGFSVWVSRRTPLMLELNGGPDGYIYGVGRTINGRNAKT